MTFIRPFFCRISPTHIRRRMVSNRCSPFIEHNHAASHSHSRSTFFSIEKNTPSCVTCTHYIHHSKLCARFWMYSNYCRYDEKKCGTEARFWTPIRSSD